MSVPTIQTSFSTGEIAPALYGRVDLAREKNGATTMRNMFVGYRGGAYSRPGTAFVGFSKQTGRAYAPRLIPFQFSINQGLALEFGNHYMRVISDGAFVTEAPITITNITRGFPAVVTVSAIGALANTNWVYIANVNGMTQINGRTFVIGNISGNTFQLFNPWGNAIDSAGYNAYTSSGTAARVYTLTTPWNEADLSWLKFAQSADVMSICCVNQVTGTTYQPVDLSRTSDDNWTVTNFNPGQTITAPTSPSGSASSSGSVDYNYVITAVSAADGTESIASTIVDVSSAVDIASTAGTITLTWTAVAGAEAYNIYKATPGYDGTAVPAGVLFGFAGQATGTSFLDSNIVADFTQVPPQHINPFDSSSDYPGCVAYFQQRRAYADTLNNPDTYFMSQPGSFGNFDYRIPTIDSDAITGSPWSVEVNGIQFMLNTTPGLVVFTGLQAWLLVGAGSFATNVQPITPSSQDALPQPAIGCAPTLAPILVDYDVLFVSSLGSYYYDLPYQLYALSQPVDTTEASAHLFTDFTILSHAWCRQPYKLLWAVRDDGVLLSLTWHKQQAVSGWARSDTVGSFVSNCSISEPPVDAHYLAAKRSFGYGEAYTIERMDDRIWNTTEETWCVDCGFELAQPKPNANLFPQSAIGLGAVTGGTINIGGQNYSTATVASVFDAPLGEGAPVGTGYGATPTVGFTNGVLTSISFGPGMQGQGYTNPQLLLSDPTNEGSGASVTLTLNNAATFVFDNASIIGSPPPIGQIIRAGGGVATVTALPSPTSFTVNISNPIADLEPNTGGFPAFQPVGSWTMSGPVTQIFIPEFAGTTLVALADGVPVAPSVVSNEGYFTLPNPATSVIIGFTFQAQLQTPYLDDGSPTIAGARKKISEVVARVEQTPNTVQTGSNQPDGSTLTPPQLSPSWNNLDNLGLPTLTPYNSNFTPLYTGDLMRIPVQAGFAKPGQVAFQQTKPQPMAILAVISEAWEGDTPEAKASPKKQKAA